MAARSIGSGTISFGLVSIPVKLYVATSSEQLSFNLLHEECGTRIKQQLYCPHCQRVVERSETVKGYQFQKDRYVTFTDEELKALEAEANRSIDITEFVPLGKVDPIYFENSHYLGPDEGAEKAYHLLVEAMRDTDKVGLAQFTRHGKEHLALIRPFDRGLVLHSMYYADEVRTFGEIDLGAAPKVRPHEVELAQKLIEQLSADTFAPERFKDEYRDRVQEAVNRKVEGEEIRIAAPEPQRAQVIDLMDALKASLGRKGTAAEPRKAAANGAAGGRRRPAAAARRRETHAPRRRAHKE